MAGGDYYSCDQCGCKTFYDAELYHDWSDEEENRNPETNHPWPDGNIGFMIVLCRGCAETLFVKILPKEHTQEEK